MTRSSWEAATIGPCRGHGSAATDRGSCALFVRERHVGFWAMEESAVCGVVIEDFAIPSPVQRGIELAFHFLMAEVVIENVAKEFLPDRMITLGVQRALDQPQNRDIL